jgi:AcrR family transcriptional regulator
MGGVEEALMAPAAVADAAAYGRPPGRPRSQGADRAILDATVDVLAEEGVSGLTVEAVAQRAGVGKATIYRRFRDKEDLLTGVIATLGDDVVAPEQSLGTRQALVALVEQVWDAMSRSRAWRIMPRLVSCADSHPELFSCYFRTVVAPRHALVAEVLRRGIERGEIRPDLDLDLAAAVLLGPAVYLTKMRPTPMTHPADGTADALVGLFLQGAQSTATPGAAGRARTRR